MKYKVLDTIVLITELPEYKLRKGDLGAVVHVYEPDGLEVEFVTASGRTEALVTLTTYVQFLITIWWRCGLSVDLLRGYRFFVHGTKITWCRIKQAFFT